MWRCLSGRLVTGGAGVLRPGRRLAVRACGWLLLLVAVLLALAASPQLLGAALHRDIPYTPAVALGSTLASCCAYALLVRAGEKRSVRELSLAPAPLQFASGALIGAGLLCATVAVLVLGGLYRVRPGHASLGLVPILFGVCIAVREELLFRGVVFRLLTRVFGAGTALALSALLFGLAHLLSPHATLTAAVAIAVEAGLLLGACLLLTGRLWLGIGLHAAWNITEGSVLGASVSGHTPAGALLISTPVAGASAFWSGDGFGPEASPAAMLVCLGAFAVMLALRRSRGHAARPEPVAPALLPHPTSSSITSGR